MKSEVAYSSEYVSNKYVSLNACGEQYLGDRDYIEYNKGRVDFSLKYISKGKGFVESNGEAFELGEGELIIYFPSCNQKYSFKKEDKSQMLWAHFSGEICEMLEPLNKNGIAIVKILNKQEFEYTFKKMILQHYFKVSSAGDTDVTKKLCEGYLLTLIPMLIRDASVLSVGGKESTSQGIDKVLNYMNVKFNDEIDITAYAQMCALSKDRFLHLFKEKTGISPYKFQLLIRIERAKALLTNTSLSVGECAQGVGFKDVSYFCRIFKKYTQYTPVTYRKNFYQF